MLWHTHLTVGGRFIVPQGCPCPNHRTHETVHGQRDLVDVTKGKDLEMREHLRLSWWAQSNHESLKAKSLPQALIRGGCDWGRKVRVMQCCWLWRWKNRSESQGVWTASRSRWQQGNKLRPQEYGKEPSPATTLRRFTGFGVLAYRTAR